MTIIRKIMTIRLLWKDVTRIFHARERLLTCDICSSCDLYNELYWNWSHLELHIRVDPQSIWKKNKLHFKLTYSPFADSTSNSRLKSLQLTYTNTKLHVHKVTYKQNMKVIYTRTCKFKLKGSLLKFRVLNGMHCWYDGWGRFQNTKSFNTN